MRIHHLLRRRWVLTWALLFVVLGSAAAGGQTAATLRKSVPGCPVCDLWLANQDVVLRAKQEVGELRNGVLYFYHSDEPAVIEPLIRFAYERKELERDLDRSPAVREQLGRACGHLPGDQERMELEISTSARGIFALLTSGDPSTIEILRSEAQRAVRSKLPVWF